MDLWIKHDLANGANPDNILFDFSLETSNQNLHSAAI